MSKVREEIRKILVQFACNTYVYETRDEIEESKELDTAAQNIINSVETAWRKRAKEISAKLNL